MVVSSRYPYLEIWFRVRSHEETVSAYIDTGDLDFSHHMRYT